MDSFIIEKIKKEIENFTPVVNMEKIGRVIRVGDGIAEIEGLENAKMSEMILFDESSSKKLEEAIETKENLYGLVLNLEEDSVKVAILGDTDRVSEDMLVKSTGKLLSIPVGEAFIGRVVNTLAEPLDGKGSINATEYAPIEHEAYGVLDRKSVHTPLHTGMKAIDSMVPIGRGQRELIIGDRFTGKTTIAIDTILNQKNEPEETRPICIYVAIGQKESKTARLVAQLEEAGAMEYTIVISASAATPAALQYLAPFAGATMGEYFMNKGRDALVVYDDLSKQAVAYRQISLLLRRPPGREAYPGDIFYLHSRLLERAAKLSDEKGGGSLTALPIIETQEGDVASYIPTNVISITDGQIFLDANLFNKGIRPAIDVGNSVSRVGSSAQTKAMKSVGGSIRIELAQFRELEAFMQFAQDLDEVTKTRINRGQKITELLKQRNGEPLPFEKQVVSIYAGIHGLFEKVAVAHVSNVEHEWLLYIDGHHNNIFTAIHNSKAINDEIIQKLDAAQEDFIHTYTSLFPNE